MTEATRSSAAPPLRQLEGGHEQRDKQEHDLHRGEAVQQKDKRPHLPEPRLHDQDHHEDGTDELRRAQENSEGKKYSGSRTNTCRAWGWQEGRGAGAAACGGGVGECRFSGWRGRCPSAASLWLFSR